MRKLKNYAIGTAIVTAIACPPLWAAYSYFVPDRITTRINGAERAPGGDFFVYSDYGMFRNHNAWYRLKFNKRELQNRAIQFQGKTVEVRKYGWQSDFFSISENILDVREAE